MKAEDYWLIAITEKIRSGQVKDGLETGRVVAEHKERYILRSLKGEYEAEITGNMRYTASGREDFPVVGDWVAMTAYDHGFGIIHKILPRSSLIKRQAAGKAGEIQVIAANIDFALILQAPDRDFNINRLERYLTICHSSGVKPVIVLTKTDLIHKELVSELSGKIKARISHIPVLAISNVSREGYEGLKELIEKGKTYCMLGSSGVGKSTLLNNLSGTDLMRTENLSTGTGKGRHVTSHRELIVLENGGFLIDNPGMREVGITDSTVGLETTFDRIFRLSQYCRYKDCTHTTEAGCSVIEAVGKGALDKASYENYLRLEKEKAYFESTVAERRKKEKIFGKMVKNYYRRDIKQKRNRL